jgi:hypothetical protein
MGRSTSQPGRPIATEIPASDFDRLDMPITKGQGVVA